MLHLQKQRLVNIFNVESNKSESRDLPPRRKVIQTVYKPNPTASRLPQEMQFADAIQAANPENPAMMIVCADIEARDGKFEYFLSYKKDLTEAGLGNYSAIRKSASDLVSAQKAARERQTFLQSSLPC
ncbi:MAG: hypothetical protein COB76_04770 [Alphaproteobacteria bacterium]|nr:MAG: hypothetical protein COB76_04770 [Alphaproteobacteria bacterium]